MLAAILVVAAALGPGGSEGQQPQPPEPRQAPTMKTPPPKASTRSQAADSYVGEVILVDGTYFLRSGSSQYMLQDQAKGKQYAGQTVEVKGSLDSRNTLRIQSIATYP
jgi:uncharacterized protein YdeI (BOF family)